MDMQTLGLVIGAVIVVTILLYIYDRRSKQQAIDVFDATKLAMGAGAIAGGVTYAVGGDAVTDAVESIASAIPDAQEMFVGKPEF
jgi:multisubunit Na+/H+ antiporter MnhB subunit